ncbi:MAG: hypothetical protein HOP16_18555 [Acidobacteria bacterium]|nr:hypothetical protein [Acidobacteriota bacterium]
MTRLLALGVLFVTCLVAISAQEPENRKPRGDFIEMLALPEAQQDLSLKEVVATLAAGTVKTVSAARFWAFRSGAGDMTGKVDLRSDELPYVTGLFYVETVESPRDLPGNSYGRSGSLAA